MSDHVQPASFGFYGAEPVQGHTLAELLAAFADRTQEYLQRECVALRNANEAERELQSVRVDLRLEQGLNAEYSDRLDKVLNDQVQAAHELKSEVQTHSITRDERNDLRKSLYMLMRALEAGDANATTTAAQFARKMLQATPGVL